MAELAQTGSFQGKLVWVENVPSAEWTHWSEALLAYADACRNVELWSRTVFVVVLGGEITSADAPEEVALVRQDFRNVVDSLDLLILSLLKAPTSIESREQRALLAHTVAQVAQWDSLLADMLLTLPIEKALSPDEALRQYARQHRWTADTPRCWASGTVDGPEQRPIVHSALLSVSGESRSVRRRIWAAQAAVLLPLVDEQRVALATRCRRYLKMPIELHEGVWAHEPDDLEIGDLASVLHRATAPGPEKKQARRLRDVRNKLAHMEALQPALALAVADELRNAIGP